VRRLAERAGGFLGAQGVAGKGLPQVLQNNFLRKPVGFGADVSRRVGDDLEAGVTLQ